jgi:hypothetical protein
MLLNSVVACTAVLYLLRRRVDFGDVRGTRWIRGAGVIYLLLGLLWMFFGAGIYGSPLVGAPHPTLALMGLALGPFFVLPSRYLIRDTAMRGVALILGGCASPLLIVYGINEISDMLL